MEFITFQEPIYNSWKIMIKKRKQTKKPSNNFFSNLIKYMES